MNSLQLQKRIFGRIVKVDFSTLALVLFLRTVWNGFVGKLSFNCLCYIVDRRAVTICVYYVMVKEWFDLGILTLSYRMGANPKREVLAVAR